MDSEISRLIELNDQDELLREIDRRCESSDWDGLLELRDRCHLAAERGLQLWGAAAHAEYRIALHAPGKFAAEILDSKPSPFLLGPLPEVAASTHEWKELDESIPHGFIKATTAYECVALGADLTDHPQANEFYAQFEMPLVLQAWEPHYVGASYKSDRAAFLRSPVDVLERTLTSKVPFAAIDDQAVDALRSVTRIWTDESDGITRVVAVEGGLSEVASCLDIEGEFVRITLKSAIEQLAWAGASGGARGRRAGLSAGRSKAWVALSGVTGLLESWPPDPEELHEIAQQIEWWTWAPINPDEGWQLHLIAVDPVDGVAFGVESIDILAES